MTRPRMLPSATVTASAPESEQTFRGSMAGLHAPLSTLRRTPRDVLRMTRGQLDSLRLGRRGLSPLYSLPVSRRTAVHTSSSHAQHFLFVSPLQGEDISTATTRVARGNGAVPMLG